MGGEPSSIRGSRHGGDFLGADRNRGRPSPGGYVRASPVLARGTDKRDGLDASATRRRSLLTVDHTRSRRGPRSRLRRQQGFGRD